MLVYDNAQLAYPNRLIRSKKPSGHLTLNRSNKIIKDLEGYWPIHKPDKYNVTDISGNNKHGFFVPHAAGEDDAYTVVDGNLCANFISTSDSNIECIEVTGPVLSGTGPITINCWLYMTDSVVDDHYYVISRRHSDDSGSVYLYVQGSPPKMRVWVEGLTTGGAISGSTTILTNRWYMGTLVFDGSSLRVYLNGTQDAYTATTGNRTNSNDETQFGSSDVTSSTSGLWDRAFRGHIEQVAIWKRALAAPEVKSLYLYPYQMIEGM